MKNRVMEIGFAACCVIFYCVIFYLVAVVKFLSPNPGPAVTWFAMGSMFLCMFSAENANGKKRNKVNNEKSSSARKSFFIYFCISFSRISMSAGQKSKSGI